MKVCWGLVAEQTSAGSEGLQWLVAVTRKWYVTFGWSSWMCWETSTSALPDGIEPSGTGTAFG